MAENSIRKIAVVGAESTGKSWLCEALAKHYDTALVPEYAREYFNDSDIYNYTLSDLEAIAKRQMALERELIGSANRFLFCDTTLVTLKIWAELEFKHTPSYISEQLQYQDYYCYLITDNQVPWAQDPLRQNKYSRDLLLQMNEWEVKKSGIPYAIISGMDEARLANAIRLIDAL